ncbi:class I SAM-dependent methyltransferase [bacterium]|nr:class I SAM-dependent methyltransferase [bacterium]
MSKKIKFVVSHPYTHFALIYDELMGDRYEKLWWKSFLRLSRQHRLKYECIADLAGGTGAAALRLYAPGKKIWIVDKSQAMLRQAKQKLPQAICLVQDIRHFRLPEKVDLVVCMYGGIHYLESLSEVRRFFQAVRRVLKPGGVFCFDQYTLQYLKKLCKQKQRVFEGENYKCYWNMHWDQKKRCAEIHMRGFEGQPRAWQNSWSEKHFHYAFLQKDVKKELKSANFDKIMGNYANKNSKMSQKDNFKLILAK